MSSRPSRGAARLAAILDALPDGLVLVNANGTVVNANTIALEMFETPGTALVGRGLLDLLPEFDSKLIPGSMRRPESADRQGRTKPTRMTAQRTNGSEFPVEVTSASVEDGRDAYNDAHSYTGDELLMLVVRDLSGTLDTEAELARSQRQTEMILRAASEGVVGTDTDGRVVLVNPAAAQILGFRATDLGGRELHTLVLHSRADGEPFPYSDSPLADTLRSGRKHRVRGQVLWAKDGSAVPVDLTTAPVRDGEQLVGAVMTFTDRRAHEELVEQHRTELAETKKQHAAELAETRELLTAELKETTERLTAQLAAVTEGLTQDLDHATERHSAELADRSDRYAAEIEELTERYDDVNARHAQLTAVLGEALRGPLDELRGELSALASDPAGQLWPEANQILHHLAAGYARMTTLVDNVLGYQRLDAGIEQLNKTNVLLDGVVAAGVEGAVELIGPGRAQYAVHAPPIEAEVDGVRLATALAHLVADVAGVDATGRARLMPGGGYVDSTIVVAAAQRGDVVRIEVRGPFAGGDPVHEPIVCGIVRAHGGVLQTHEVPGMSGMAYVLELPLGGGSGAIAPPPPPEPAPSGQPGPATAGGGRRRARRSSTDAFLDSPVGKQAEPTGRRRAMTATDSIEMPAQSGPQGPGAPADPGTGPVTGHGPDTAAGSNGGTGRRRGQPSPGEDTEAPPTAPGTGSATALPAATPAAPSEGSVVTSAEGSHPTGRAAHGAAVPPQGVPADPAARAQQGGLNVCPALPAGPVQVPASPGAGSPPAATVPGQPAALRLPAAVPAQAPRAMPAGAPTGALPPGNLPPGTVPPGTVPARTVPAETVPSGAAPSAQPAAARRTRRTLAPVQERHIAPPPAQATGPRSAFALPPAEADRALADPTAGPAGSPVALPSVPDASHPARHDAVRAEPDADHTPPQAHPVPTSTEGLPTGPQRAHNGPDTPPGWGDDTAGRQVAGPVGATGWGGPGKTAGMAASQQRTAQTISGFGNVTAPPGRPAGPGTTGSENLPVGDGTGQPTDGSRDSAPATGAPGTPATPAGTAPVAPASGPASVQAADPSADPSAANLPAADPSAAQPPVVARQPLPPAQPLPDETPMPSDATQGRAFSVRTLGQGVPFAQRINQQQNHPLPRNPTRTGTGVSPGTGSQSGTLGSGRRRKLGTPPDSPLSEENSTPAPTTAPQTRQRNPASAPGQPQTPGSTGASRLATGRTEGRSYTIGAPDEGAEGPEPLDGPGGAVEVANRPSPQPVDAELPPEPLDNPRRLLVWPAPDVATQQALSDRGYRPVVVHSREEIDAQLAAFPAALFVDPLTGPITRTALQSLRQAAVAAEVPVLVTAGLGQATREAAYGADPAVLLKALAPRDSEQHPPRVLLVERHGEIALALTAMLERRGMQVARAGDDGEAVTLATQMRPNLVVMDLLQVQRERAGIIDWLRANGELNHTPLVVYTSAGINRAELPRLASGETVLFLAERSTSDEVQSRIVDLLARIGTN